MPDAVFINTDDRITFCNSAFVRLLGGESPADYLGVSPLSVFHPRYHDVIRQRIELLRTLCTAVPMVEEEVVHLVDGTIPVEVVTTNIFHDDQLSILVILRDLRRTRDLERRFRALVEAVTDYAIFTMDAAGTIVTWNEGAARLYGYTAAEALGQPHDIFFRAEDVAAGAPARDLAAALAAEAVLEEWRVRKDGSRFWGRIVVTALRDSDGRPQGFVKVARDLTESRASAAALSTSERRNVDLFDCVPDPLVVYDRETLSYLAVNDAAVAEYGYSRDELLGMTIRDLRPVDDVPALLEMLAHSGAGQESRGVWRHQRKDGSVLQVEISARGIDFGGRPACLVHARDVTAHRLGLEQIAEQAALLDEARDAIVVRDLDLHLTYANASAARLYGLNESDGGSRGAVEHLYRDPSAVELARRTTLEHGGWDGELELARVAGRTTLVASHWSLVRDKAGSPRAVLIISTDITEKKRMEAQFIRAQRTESLGTLAGGIAHDLNNILTPILASIDLLIDDVEGNNEALETLDTLRICARRGADLVKQVLSFARGIEAERVPVDLAVLARELFKVLADTLPKALVLRLDSAEDLWTVSGDPTQLHQVLLNLCVNARDAMPEGGALEVSLANVVIDDTYAAMNLDARAGPYVMVQVTDTGSGIPRAVLERIFDPFFTTKDVGSGTGLGLSTTSTVVKSHGGFINVYSEVGKGTKFEVYLPADTSNTGELELEIEQASVPRGQGELVLVVDDEEAIRRVVRRTLERFGYRVLLASNGAEAVALYAQHRAEIAVVLTDMAMPVMDGPATIIAIQTIDPHAKIVGSSGLVSNSNVARAVGAGVVHFVPKPYTSEALLKTLRAAIASPPSG
ncbi:MAG: PAS domain S-box protein [Myxococcota bacterium]|nr:PAS domain S-box protein [Myxococcota bacterium]